MDGFLCCQGGVEGELTVLEEDIIWVLALQARVFHVFQLRLSVMREHLFEGPWPYFGSGCLSCLRSLYLWSISQVFLALRGITLEWHNLRETHLKHPLAWEPVHLTIDAVNCKVESPRPCRFLKDLIWIESVPLSVELVGLVPFNLFYFLRNYRHEVIILIDTRRVAACALVNGKDFFRVQWPQLLWTLLLEADFKGPEGAAWGVLPSKLLLSYPLG